MRKRPGIKTPWTDEEASVVLRFFASDIRKLKVPGKAACSKCINENGVLGARTWKIVKDFVRNHITKVKKLQSKGMNH